MVAESSAGGLINAALVAVPGASAYYLGGCVIYTGAGHSALLGLTAQDMAGIRSASEPFARLLAQRVRKDGRHLGPEQRAPAAPTGTGLWGCAGACLHRGERPVEAVITLETGSADREANMRAFARAALELLESCLRKTG